MYNIDNFSVKIYTGSNRCFEMDHHIILLKSSLISKVDDHYTIVPPDICMFANLKNIHELGSADSALIDVVGMVCSVKQEKNITTHSLEGRTYVDFKITDFINKVKVRFWDDVGHEFYNSFSQATVLPAAIIIASAKLRRNNYTRLSMLTNAPATVFYINPDCERVESLRRSLFCSQHERVHAWSGETTLLYFDKLFREGNVYEIKNFVVKYYESSELNMCFSDDKRIILSCLTRGVALKNEYCHIPFDMWKFTDLGKLFEFDENINHFIDVVGIIDSVDEAEVVNIPGKKPQTFIIFCITNTIDKVKVKFSGKFALLLDELLMKANEHPVVISISSCKICLSKDSEERSICSTLSTKFTTNDNMQIVQTLRKRLALHVENPKGHVIDSAALALKLLNDVRVDVIIGPQKSSQANFVIDLGDRAHVPVISFSATSPSLFRRTPYFIQTAQSDATQVGAIASIFKKFQWREAVVIFEDTDYGHGMIPYLANEFYDNDVRLSYRSIIPLHPTEDFILKELYKMMTMQTRVYVVHMSRPLAARLFLKAQELGMMSEGYAWIVSSGIMDMMSSLDSLVVESMQGVLGVKPQIPESENLNSFSRKFFQNSNVNKETNLSFIGLWAYDTLWALALAAERVGYSDLIPNPNGSNMDTTNLLDLKISETGPKILQAMLLTRFKGLSGKFSLVNGQVEPSAYQILNVVVGGVKQVGTWSPAHGLSRMLEKSGKTYQGTEDLQGVIWPGESIHIPRGWEIHVGGKKLKIGVPVKDGFTEFLSAERDLQTNTTKASGHYIDLFDSVIKALPYSVQYEYVPFLIGIDGSYNDFVHQVFLQKFDAAVGDITITTNRSRYVDFTMPISEGGVSMIVPITYEDSNNKWTFLKPLQKDLWLTTIAFFIFTGFAVWVLEHRINTAFRGPPSQHVGMICWFPLSTVVFAHSKW
ncbi:glutamate receptor 2.2-like [Apium graveolens]|uniref:glutamate receptor 2.2-like n=1 Tax=Apium graveolens TaxID=4045 RepID=UPI003D7A2D61